jgi:hypothetical protein
MHPVEAEVFHADRQTNKMKLIDTFCNFVNTPENKSIHSVFCRYEGFLCKKFHLKFLFFFLICILTIPT